MWCARCGGSQLVNAGTNPGLPMPLSGRGSFLALMAQFQTKHQNCPPSAVDKFPVPVYTDGGGI